MVAAAVIGGAALGAVASNSAANKGVKAAGAANDEAAREYDQTRADQFALLDRQRADQLPWLDAGKTALAQLAAGTDAGGSLTRAFGLADFQADPGYDFRVSEGEKAIQRAASGRGGLYSGATLKALARFNQDTASGEYNNAYNRYNNDQSAKFNRLASIAGLGQTATNQVGQAGQSAYGTIASAGANASNAIQNNLTGAANARASGYVGGANAIGNGISQYMNYTQNQNLLSALSRNPGMSISESSLPALQMPALNTSNFNVGG
jgi:hypothetical protein